MIELDRTTHTYTGNLLSVTTVLEAAGLIDTSHYTEEAKDRGSKIHLACEYFDQNDLNLANIDDRIRGYVQAYIKFRNEHGAATEGSEWIEIPMADKTGSYAGTPDRVLVKRPRAVWDLKTGSFQPWHPIQLAAYVNMLDDPFSYDRVGLYLQPDGKYSVKPFSKQEFMADLGIFLSALNVVNWRRNHGSRT
jgi:hypothetical protein